MSTPVPTQAIHQAHVSRDGGYGAAVHNVETQLGAVQLEICTECSLVEAQCLHENNVWNEDGTVLTCRLCALDVT